MAINYTVHNVQTQIIHCYKYFFVSKKSVSADPDVNTEHFPKRNFPKFQWPEMMYVCVKGKCDVLRTTCVSTGPKFFIKTTQFYYFQQFTSGTKHSSQTYTLQHGLPLVPTPHQASEVLEHLDSELP